MRQWSITKLVAIGALAVVDLAMGATAGGIQAAIGVPGSAGIIMIFLGPMILVFCGLLIRRFGAVTIMLLIYSTLALPLPVAGTPGFLPKILIGLVSGLATDTVFLLLRNRKRAASIVIGAINPPIFQFLILGFGVLLSVPGTQSLAKVLLSPITVPVIAVVGALGGYTGYMTFGRLKTTGVVLRIQGQVDAQRTAE